MAEAGQVVIRELSNVLSIEVDEASAAKAEAAMRGWKAAAEDVGKVLAAVGGDVATFLNSLSGAGKLAELNEQTGMAAKPLRAWGRAALKLGATLTDLGPWVSAFTEQVKEFNAATSIAAPSTNDLRKVLQGLQKQSEKTSQDLEKIAMGLEGVKKSADTAAEKQREHVQAVISQKKESEGTISTLGRFGDAMRGVREIVNIATEGYDFLVGGLVQTSREMRASAQVAGVSTKFYQEQAYAISTLGLDADELRDVLLDMSDKAYDAANGSKEQAETFAALGVSVRDASGKLKPMETLYLDVADALQKMGEGTTRTGLASKILGEQGARLLPVLSEGSEGLRRYAAEANAVGAVLSDDTLKSSQEFEKSSRSLGAALTGIRNTIGEALLPVLADAAKEFQKFLLQNRNLVKTKVQQWVKAFSVAADIAVGVVKHLKLVLLGVAAVMVAQYLPAIAAGIASLSALTSAQLAWGSAAVIAGARAAAAQAAAFGGWLALAAIMLLVLEDLYQFGTGGESVFGEFDKWLNTFDPSDNPFVLFLKESLKGMTTLVKTSTELLFDLTNPDKWMRYFKAVISLFIPFADELFDALNIFGNRVGPSNDPAAVAKREAGKKRSAVGGFFAGSMMDLEDLRNEGYRIRAARVASPAWGAEYGTAVSALQQPMSSSAMFGRGGSGDAAMSSIMSAKGGGGPFAPVVTIQQEINALPGQSEVDVGRAAATQGADAFSQQLRAFNASYSRGGTG